MMWQGYYNKMCQIMYKIEVKKFLIIPQDFNSEIIEGKKQGALPTTINYNPSSSQKKPNKTKLHNMLTHRYFDSYWWFRGLGNVDQKKKNQYTRYSIVLKIIRTQLQPILLAKLQASFF